MNRKVKIKDKKNMPLIIFLPLLINGIDSYIFQLDFGLADHKTIQ